MMYLHYVLCANIRFGLADVYTIYLQVSDAATPLNRKINILITVYARQFPKKWTPPFLLTSYNVLR